MLVFQSNINRLEAQLGGRHRRTIDAIESNYRDRPDGCISAPTEPLTAVAKIINQYSISFKNNRSLHIENLTNAVAKSCDHIRMITGHPSTSEPVSRHLNDLLWLANAKASVQTIFAALKVSSENVLLIEEELRYWEDILGLDWSVGLYTLQTFPYRAWRNWMNRYHDGNNAIIHRRASDDSTSDHRSVSEMWLRFYTSVQQYISPAFCPSGLGISSALNWSKFDIQNRRRKLKAARDIYASAVGILLEGCLCVDMDLRKSASDSDVTYNDLHQIVRTNISLLKVVLGNHEVDNGFPDHAQRLLRRADKESQTTEFAAAADPLDPHDTLEEVKYILTDLFPRYKHAPAEAIRVYGRPSPVVRYWLPLSFALVSTTTLIKIAKSVGPALIKSISNFGPTALDFWRNWVVEPTWKLVRTIRHDETSDIALMSKSSLKADRASLERMVVDFVLDRADQNQPASFPDAIADKVREGDLTPVLRAYEKDLRSPFMGTLRGDLVRALLIQIQKTKVDVEVAMSGIDALLRSQELVFGFVGLTPGLLISYASIRWVFGRLGSRRGFRLGRRQHDLRYALRKIHRILSTSSPTREGRLSYRNHGLLLCNIEVLLMKAQTILKTEDFRAFQEDSSDLIDETQVEKQLRVVERIAWTYSKWM
ncbi:ATP synthase regulation protein NCA2-domain-containing protein [Aspergillus venezuelensis]